MNTFSQLLRSRRSVRDFQRKPVEQDKIDALTEAALLSPTAKNRRPWQFIIVEKEETIADLSRCKAHGAGFMAGAPLAIVVAADPQEASAWIEDASIASIIIQLAAEDLGLGSCWVQIRGRSAPDGGSASDYIRRLLEIPDGMEVEAVIALGYPASSPAPHDLKSLPQAQVHYGAYGRGR